MATSSYIKEILHEGDGDAILGGQCVKIRYKAIDKSAGTIFDCTNFEDPIEQLVNDMRELKMIGVKPGMPIGASDADMYDAEERSRKESAQMPNMGRDTLVSLQEEKDLNGYEVQVPYSKASAVKSMTIPLPLAIYEALLSMREGESAIITLPPSSGFGDEGWPLHEDAAVSSDVKGTKPAKLVSRGATLEYHIKVVSAGIDVSTLLLGDDEMSRVANLKEVERQVQAANNLFKAARYTTAYRKYCMAFSFLDAAFDLSDSEGEDEEGRSEGESGMSSKHDKDLVRKERTRILSNMAATAMKLELYATVIAKCNSILRLDKDNIKGIYNRSMAFIRCGEFTSAKKDLKRGLKLAPSDKSFKDGLALLKQRQGEVKSKEKRLFGGFFNRKSTPKVAEIPTAASLETISKGSTAELPLPAVPTATCSAATLSDPYPILPDDEDGKWIYELES